MYMNDASAVCGVISCIVGIVGIVRIVGIGGIVGIVGIVGMANHQLIRADVRFGGFRCERLAPTALNPLE